MAKTLYFGGPVVTMESPRPAGAALIEDGVIRRVGTREAVSAAAAGAREVDLEGRALLPAFIDPHSHITSLAATLGAAALGGARDFGDIAARLRRFIAANPPAPGGWAVGSGYDHNTLSEGRHPTREVLDAVSADIPIVIAHASGHMGVMNTAALRQLGIAADTPDPPGGVIGRGADGAPSGYLEETAFTAAAPRIPQPAPRERLRLLRRAQEVYLSRGITTVQDGFTRAGDLELLLRAAGEGALRADVVSYLDLQEGRALAAAHPALVRRYQGRLKIGGYKIFLDGSPQGRTAYMSEPYQGAADGYRGYPAHTDGEVERFAAQALADGMQLLAHCNGDAAAAQYIAAYAAARRGNPAAPDLRPVMIHAQLLRRDQLPAMRALGMIASFFVAHTYYWGDVHLKNFGRARAGAISPARSALENGVLFTFHQDTPVLEPDMLRTLWCAVLRVTRAGAALDEGECLPVYEALRAVTANAAYQYFEEGEKGTIREGKRADLVILEQNPLAAPPDSLPGIRVLETIKDGETVFRQN